MSCNWCSIRGCGPGDLLEAGAEKEADGDHRQNHGDLLGAWINEMKVDVKNGKISPYRVNMKVTFVLKD